MWGSKGNKRERKRGREKFLVNMKDKSQKNCEIEFKNIWIFFHQLIMIKH